MPQILLTGGAGFIGSHLAEALLEAGHRVVVLDSLDDFYPPAVKRGHLALLARYPGFSFIEADIAQPFALWAHLLPGGPYRALIHLAAQAGVRGSLADPAKYYRTNVLGTLHLLEWARQGGTEQVLFASSSSIYGENPAVPWQEETPLTHPASPYGASKLAAEDLGRLYSRLYGLQFIALRLFTVYGPRQRPDLAIHKFLHLMQQGKAIPFYGDGTTRRDYTYVADIVAGFRAALEYAPPGFHVFNLGSHRPVTLTEMVQTLEQVTGLPAVLERLPAQPGDVSQTYADVSRAGRELGYHPSISFAEGVRQFWQWYGQQGTTAQTDA